MGCVCSDGIRVGGLVGVRWICEMWFDTCNLYDGRGRGNVS